MAKQAEISMSVGYEKKYSVSSIEGPNFFECVLAMFVFSLENNSAWVGM